MTASYAPGKCFHAWATSWHKNTVDPGTCMWWEPYKTGELFVFTRITKATVQSNIQTSITHIKGMNHKRLLLSYLNDLVLQSLSLSHTLSLVLRDSVLHKVMVICLLVSLKTFQLHIQTQHAVLANDASILATQDAFKLTDVLKNCMPHMQLADQAWQGRQ